MLRLSPPALTAGLRQPLGVGFPFPQRRPGLTPPHRQRLSVENQPQIYDLFPITNKLSHSFFENKRSGNHLSLTNKTRKSLGHSSFTLSRISLVTICLAADCKTLKKGLM